MNKIKDAEKDHKISERIPPKVLNAGREKMVSSPYFSADALSF